MSSQTNNTNRLAWSTTWQLFINHFCCFSLFVYHLVCFINQMIDGLTEKIISTLTKRYGQNLLTVSVILHHGNSLYHSIVTVLQIQIINNHKVPYFITFDYFLLLFGNLKKTQSTNIKDFSNVSFKVQFENNRDAVEVHYLHRLSLSAVLLTLWGSWIATPRCFPQICSRDTKAV